ncbi:hypothetical protein AJ80_03048 [Polytolypa hystricis UAMH7299]|uniref:Peptidase M48 domain-containing protein n=1 Tax=Polytolypa hystricis (strain UAMH7299) TaxID=1447883 RepID=A0A2B7YJW6_POLH7|nr:hypothetical protein AJ80_03048 [Polytolypa hystricis UAMH7299]
MATTALRSSSAALPRIVARDFQMLRIATAGRFAYPQQTCARFSSFSPRCYTKPAPISKRLSHSSLSSSWLRKTGPAALLTRAHISPTTPSPFLPHSNNPASSVQRRAQSHFPRGKTEIYEYHRFGGRGGGRGRRGGGGGGMMWHYWDQYWHLIVGVGGVGVGFYVWNLEEVPMTGRRRFNCFTNAQELIIGQQTYEQMMQEFRPKILPDHHPDVVFVRRVLARLISPEQLQDKEMEELKWEVHVIHDPAQLNAFVLPGGKVFVFTGIFPICRDEDGLAAVLGHEIAHVRAHHTAERMSSSILSMIAIIAASLFFDVSGNVSSMMFNLMFNLPNSRTQEAEADEIGLMMMAKGCYNPEAAAALWSRMMQAEKISPPQIMSTHPSSRRRLEAIRGWLPAANVVYEDSGCGITSSYVQDFGQALGSFGW